MSVLAIIFAGFVGLLVAFAEKIAFAVMVLLLARWVSKLMLRVKKNVLDRSRAFRMKATTVARGFWWRLRFVFGPTVTFAQN